MVYTHRILGAAVMTSLKKKWIKFRDTELLPYWYYHIAATTSDPLLVTQNAAQVRHLKCYHEDCTRHGTINLVNGKWTLAGLDPGHIRRRGSHPELICDINNVRPECRKHNSLAAGVPKWTRTR